MKTVVLSFLLSLAAAAQTVKPALPSGSTGAAAPASPEFTPRESDPIEQATPLPKRFRLTKTTMGFLIADCAVRAQDAYTTHRGMQIGFHEANLPDSIAQNNAAMWAYSMGFVATNAFISYKLEKHGHPLLARTFSAIDVTLTLPQVLDNWSKIRPY